MKTALRRRAKIKMDWTKVQLPKTKTPKRFQSGELADLDHWKLIVAAKLLRKSVAATIQTAVYTYLQRNWAEHEARLEVEAQTRGMTPEELFMELTNGEGDSSND
jgi:hypothetical protein